MTNVAGYNLDQQSPPEPSVILGMDIIIDQRQQLGDM
jgi:hypothetical protein